MINTLIPKNDIFETPDTKKTELSRPPIQKMHFPDSYIPLYEKNDVHPPLPIFKWNIPKAML